MEIRLKTIALFFNRISMSKVIWVIDDDPGIREVTQIILEEAGFEVKTIGSKKELTVHLKTTCPDVILLDIQLSGLSGSEVAVLLKSNEKTKSTPIIMMSADADLERKTKEAGANDYLRKPYDIEALEAIVNKYVT